MPPTPQASENVQSSEAVVPFKPNTQHAKDKTYSSTSSDETAVDDDVDIIFSEISMAKYNILPGVGPPSEEEQTSFYYGITSRPRLVGRASSATKPWVSLREQKMCWSRMESPPHWLNFIKKRLSNIGVHPIRTCWEKLEPEIIMAVSRLPWNSIDIMRMTEFEENNGEEHILDSPVVVWISIQNHEIAWSLVVEALRACQVALDAKNLSDVDVQIRVSDVFPLCPSAETTEHPSCSVENSPGVDPFCATMGASMFPFACPHINGTLGLFVSPDTPLSNETEQVPVWALTCRHVSLPKDTGATNTTYRVQDSAGNERHLICLPSDEDTRTALFLLENEKTICEKIALQSGLKKDRLALEKASANITAAKTLEHKVVRISGSVLFAPPISKHQTALAPQHSPITWLRDYSVFEIRRDKFPKAELTNILKLAPALDNNPRFAATLLQAQQLNQKGFQFSPGKVVRVKGTIPISEMLQHPGDIKIPRRDNCIIVVKRGFASGITFGCPSELMSTVRGSDGVNTREWAVLGSCGSKHTPFSAPGDSGAAVVGLDGRLGGFLTRGVGEQDGFTVDITYVTPAELVFADIKREMGIDIVIR